MTEQVTKSEVGRAQLANSFDRIISVYQQDVDRTLLRENLKLTVDERIKKMQSVINSMQSWQNASRRRG